MIELGEEYHHTNGSESFGRFSCGIEQHCFEISVSGRNQKQSTKSHYHHWKMWFQTVNVQVGEYINM